MKEIVTTMFSEYCLNNYQELDEAIQQDAIILLPVGQVEEHGPHLPVGTDTFIAVETAKRVAEAVRGEIPVLVMPPIWSTYTVDAIGKWPGLIKVRTRVVIDLVHDILASLLHMGFSKIVLMNAHGNNPELIKVALRELADEFEAAPILTNIWSMAAKRFNEVRQSAPGGAIHAGEYETSLMLAMGYPVDMSKAPAGESLQFESEFRARDNFTGTNHVTWSTWKVQQSRTGVFGDPTVATAETGEKVLEATVEEYVKLLREYYAWEPEGT